MFNFLPKKFSLAKSGHLESSGKTFYSVVFLSFTLPGTATLAYFIFCQQCLPGVWKPGSTGWTLFFKVQSAWHDLFVDCYAVILVFLNAFYHIKHKRMPWKKEKFHWVLMSMSICQLLFHRVLKFIHSLDFFSDKEVVIILNWMVGYSISVWRYKRNQTTWRIYLSTIS